MVINTTSSIKTRMYNGNFFGDLQVKRLTSLLSVIFSILIRNDWYWQRTCKNLELLDWKWVFLTIKLFCLSSQVAYSIIWIITRKIITDNNPYWVTFYASHCRKKQNICKHKLSHKWQHICGHLSMPRKEMHVLICSNLFTMRIILLLLFLS